MDVTMETSESPEEHGGRFTIEIWYFDTVLEIKKKVAKYRGIPVASQRLFFRDQELLDVRDTEHYSILQGSHLLLVVQRPPDRIVRVDAALPSGSRRLVSLQAGRDATVAELKRRIHRESGIAAPLERLVARYGKVELQDDNTLGEYEDVADAMDVKITVRRRPKGPAPPTKMAVVLQMAGGARKMSMQVDSAEKVAELRRELSKLHARAKLQLPAGGEYRFVYRGKAMDEGQTFLAHGVKAGDTIGVACGGAAARAWSLGVCGIGFLRGS